jgi:hypothetical protein
VLKNSTLLGISDCRLLKTRHVFSTVPLRATLEKGFSAAC